MSQMIPFQQAPMPAFMQQAAAAASVNQLAATGTGGNAVDSISIEGGRFSIFKGGQKVQTLGQLEMQVVIVHANPGVTKTYYDKPWNPGQDAEVPTCSSDDGVTPRADVATPQCGTCAACPMNQFGSKINPQTGAKSKACTDKKSIAVVPPGNVAGDMYRFQVPAASLADFGAFLRGLPNVPYYAVVCEISFDTTATFPKVKFKPVSYVTEEQFAIIQQRHTSDEAKAIAGVAGSVAMRAPVTQPALAAPPAYAQQPNVQAQVPVAQQQVQQPVQQEVVAQPVHVQQPVQSQPLSSTPAAADPGVAAIFGGQAVNPQTAAQPAVTAGNTSVGSTNAHSQANPAVQQGGNRHPSGREYGKPSPGKQRRTKAEMAEDAAVGYGKAAGETAEDEATAQQQVQQPAATGFGEQPVQQQAAATGFGDAPVQQQAQTYVQPANQPQVIQGGAIAGAFDGWDD